MIYEYLVSRSLFVIIGDKCLLKGFDKSGPELINLVESSKIGVVKETCCVPDDIPEIR